MKKYFLMVATFIISASAYAYDVSGDSFKAKFVIDSVNVGKYESTFNFSSDDTGQYLSLIHIPSPRDLDLSRMPSSA